MIAPIVCTSKPAGKGRALPDYKLLLLGKSHLRARLVANKPAEGDGRARAAAGASGSASAANASPDCPELCSRYLRELVVYLQEAQFDGSTSFSSLFQRL
ncbi:hypothetical protein EVAR_61386_1 [Eumeta japonica]|uniref:Uncharacterized protein n=1 Tax=Eumeta variegata TaxID=151549 RepID=A0A4C1Z5T6_EUMVA|nr:hypothetical protein EVAR_61386_1 [Eumeta japonica]